MRSKNGEAGNIKVFLDDVEQPSVEVTDDKLYTLIDMDIPGSHTLRLEFQDNNVEAFAFTFG